MATVSLSLIEKALQTYHTTIAQLRAQGVRSESGLRRAFAALLIEISKPKKWTLREEYSQKLSGHAIYYDGVLCDEYRLPHAYWEAKDSHDALDKEIQAKRARGYSFENMLFEDTQTLVLFQKGLEVGRAAFGDSAAAVKLLAAYIDYEIAPFARFDEAIAYFGKEIPTLATGLAERIAYAHQTNSAFQRAFAGFMDICKQALNPNISQAAVDEMLIQHMLTERLMRKLFDEDFVQHNVIAGEVERVITALTSASFNRREFLGALDRFYTVIEEAAQALANFSERQTFINTVYERFFQGYSVKTADTHGIVYTPQPIVDFMCASVEEVLRNEFDTELGAPGVCVLDPCTGTGNFVVNLLGRVSSKYIDQFYREQLFANEVMLMPYYIASLNIEATYFQARGARAPFEGLCFVDTLDLDVTPHQQTSMFGQSNTARVQRQLDAPMTVIIGNPPYNVGQVNENDNNKNRKYPQVDERIKSTYVKDSNATLKMQLYDMYVRFFRWSIDRLGNNDGVLVFVTNNSFADQLSFDGFRKHLLQDFTRVYHLDLHGNVRQNPKLSGSTHNVFGIQVGVGITIAIRSKAHTDHKLFYHRVPEFATAVEKWEFLRHHVKEDGVKNALNTITWQELTPDSKHTWLVQDNAAVWDSMASIGSKEAKKAIESDDTIFKSYCSGIVTRRDATVYSLSLAHLKKSINQFIDIYHKELIRYSSTVVKNVDNFIDDSIKWDNNLKLSLTRGTKIVLSEENYRIALYRPYAKRNVYFEKNIISAPGLFLRYFPTAATEQENRVIAVTDAGSEKPFMALINAGITDLHIVGAGASAQCFPLYTYDADGTRRDNITDWALAEFRMRSGLADLSKHDIFHYVYAALHHPLWRSEFAQNLKKELPRIPWPDAAARVRTWVQVGAALAQLHLGYETGSRYDLEWVETKRPVHFRVTKMKRAGNSIVINDTLTLSGIPDVAWQYKLGNRSALEWLIDQYQVDGDSDPNAYSDDPMYIVNLIERVTYVSVKTMELVGELRMQN
jgi:predicted helicase